MTEPVDRFLIQLVALSQLVDVLSTIRPIQLIYRNQFTFNIYNLISKLSSTHSKHFYILDI